MVALLIAGWLLVFADGDPICHPAPAMREWLQSEGYAFEHHHTSLDGKKYEFWANRSDSRAMLVLFPTNGPACVADDGYYYRSASMGDPYPLPSDPHHGGPT